MARMAGLASEETLSAIKPQPAKVPLFAPPRDEICWLYPAGSSVPPVI
jgi:hypothetical protein